MTRSHSQLDHAFKGWRGQGAQYVGMLKKQKDLSAVQKMFAEAKEARSIDYID